MRTSPPNASRVTCLYGITTTCTRCLCREDGENMTRYLISSAALLLLFVPGCNHRTPTDSDLFNEPAAFAAGKLPFNPLSWKIITPAIDSRQHTMSALYGNDLAVESARAGQSNYPNGAV